MIDYIKEIQRQFIDVYNFDAGKNGLPQNIPDGEYPMTIDGRKDKILIEDGYILIAEIAYNKSIQ